MYASTGPSWLAVPMWPSAGSQRHTCAGYFYPAYLKKKKIDLGTFKLDCNGEVSWEIPQYTPAYLGYTGRDGWAGNGWSLGIFWLQKTGLWQHPGQTTDQKCTLPWACLLFQKIAYSSQKYTGVNSSLGTLEWSQKKVHGWIVSVITPGQLNYQSLSFGC